MGYQDTYVIFYMDSMWLAYKRRRVIKDGSEIFVLNKFLHIGTFAKREDDLEDELVENGKE